MPPKPRVEGAFAVVPASAYLALSESAALIQQYGWSDALRLAFEPHARAGYLPGRIVVLQREANLVVTDLGKLSAKAGSDQSGS